MIEITSDISEVGRRLGELSDKADLIMSRAANRSIATVTKTMKNEAVDRYYVKKGDVGSTIKITRANSGKPYAMIVSRSEHENLFKFKVSPRRAVKILKSGKRSPKVYKASVQKSTGLQPLDGDRKPFITSTKKGTTGVFVRQSDSRRDIRGVAGPSVPQMLNNKQVIEKITEEAGKKMEERLEHEIEYALR